MAPSRRSDLGRLSPAQHKRKEKQLKRTCLFSPITHRGRGPRTCKRNLSLNLELTNVTRLTDKYASGILVPVFPYAALWMLRAGTHSCWVKRSQWIRNIKAQANQRGRHSQFHQTQGQAKQMPTHLQENMLTLYCVTGSGLTGKSNSREKG